MSALDTDRAARQQDAFAELARYYDPIMLHVDYARWKRVASGLADLLPRPLQHLDAACGTGVFLDAVATYGWCSVGVDLSPAMLAAARHRDRHHPYAVADLRALPFLGTFDLVTCLFDSVNFLLDEEDLCAALAGMARALRPGGVLYFDIITERMVLDYFEGRSWAENNGRFDSTWTSTYDRQSRLSITNVRISSGAEGTIYERVYTLDRVQHAVVNAGLELVAVMDAETFRAPNKKTSRIDLVAALDPGPELRKGWRRMQRTLRSE
jgi:SAM-dependent methyltransferase